MIIKYTPFSESVTLEQPIRNLEFADEIIKPYFVMSLRYHESYYGEQPEGNTIYFMNFQGCSLLFYFSAGPRSHRINGFRIEETERRKAWLFMLPLLQALRKYPFASGKGASVYDDDFLNNTADLEDVMIDELVPFHFIISSMPGECFPQCREMRIFNRHHLRHVEKSYYLVTKNQLRQTTMPMDNYDILSEIFWVPPIKASKKWYLEYYTGIMDKEGRNKGKYRVIRRETELPGTSGCCTYGELMRAVRPLLQDTL